MDVLLHLHHMPAIIEDVRGEEQTKPCRVAKHRRVVANKSQVDSHLSARVGTVLGTDNEQNCTWISPAVLSAHLLAKIVTNQIEGEVPRLPARPDSEHARRQDLIVQQFQLGFVMEWEEPQNAVLLRQQPGAQIKTTASQINGLIVSRPGRG